MKAKVLHEKIIVPLLLIVSGCSNIYLDTSDLLRARNAEGLAKLTTGLGKETVMEMMGTEPSKGVFMWIDNPYRSEILAGKDGKSYEVLYYYTVQKNPGDFALREKISRHVQTMKQKP